MKTLLTNSRLSLLCLAAAALVAGCASPSLTEKVEAQFKRGDAAGALVSKPTLTDQVTPQTTGTATRADQLAAQQRALPTLRRSNAAWIGSRQVPVTQDEFLPEVFKEPRTLNFADAGATVPIAVVAARLTRLTGVPVRVAPDVYQLPQGKASQAAPSQMAQPLSATPAGIPQPSVGGGPLPAGVAAAPAHATPKGKEAVKDDPSAATNATAVTVNAVEMRWQGSLQGYLNHLTDRLGLAWEYRDGAIVIMRFVSEVHEIAAFSGQVTSTFTSGGTTTGQGGGSNASTTATAQLDIKETGQQDIVSSIEKAVGDMISAVPGSSLTRTDGSGRVLVKTSREMQAQVRDFIASENAAMRRQAQIQFDVYSVRTSQSDEAGIDWNVLYRALSKDYSLAIGSPATLTGTTAGQVAFNLLTPAQGNTTDSGQRFGGSNAFINALAQMGNNVQHRPISLLALNRAWARTSELRTKGYLSETTPGPATTTGAGAPGLKTSSVTTGDSYAVMPQILQDNTVLLRFGMSLSDLIGLFDVTVGTGITFQKVQTPEVSAVNQQGTVIIKPGELMVITGLSRIVSTSDKRTLTEDLPVIAGGSRSRQVQREHFVIVVRPVLL